MLMIIMGVSIFAMEMPGGTPAIDFHGVQTQDEFMGRLKFYFPHFIDSAFSVQKDWDLMADMVSALRIDDASKKSMLDAYKRINLIPNFIKDGVTRQPPADIIEPISRLDQLTHWIAANKGKTAFVGLAAAGTLDALQAYYHADKKDWKESDFKGKLALLKRNMITTRGMAKLYHTIKRGN